MRILEADDVGRCSGASDAFQIGGNSSMGAATHCVSEAPVPGVHASAPTSGAGVEATADVRLSGPWMWCQWLAEVDASLGARVVGAAGALLGAAATGTFILVTAFSAGRANLFTLMVAGAYAFMSAVVYGVLAAIVGGFLAGMSGILAQHLLKRRQRGSAVCGLAPDR